MWRSTIGRHHRRTRTRLQNRDNETRDLGMPDLRPARTRIQGMSLWPGPDDEACARRSDRSLRPDDLFKFICTPKCATNTLYCYFMLKDDHGIRFLGEGSSPGQPSRIIGESRGRGGQTE
jgi:hypothetical protein